MKITFISNIFPPHVRGGYELGCQSIALAFSRMGHDIEVLTSASIGQLVRASPESNLPVHQIFEPVYWYEEQLDRRAAEVGYWRRSRIDAMGGIVVGNVLALETRLRLTKPDVIWLFNPLGLGIVGILETALAFPAKCVISLMDNFDATVSHYQHKIFMEGRYRRAKRQISAISCSHKTLLDNQQLGEYRSHRVIYNGIDFDAIPHGHTRPLTEPVRFVYFGQVAEAKGVLQLIRGAGEALRKHCSGAFEVHIIGRSARDFVDRMTAEVRSLGLEKCVSFVGFVERAEMISRLQHYDAAIMMLGGGEPFAYSVLEASAAGLPVILTGKSGNAEAFPRNYPLMVNDRDDLSEVGRMINLCIQNRDWARDLGASLRAHLYRICDFNSVSIPAYLRTIRACPANEGKNDIASSLANFMTARLFSDA